MLYDKHRSGPVAIPCDGLTAEDLAEFCKDMEIEFVAVGDPDNWDNTEVFRAGTIEYPSRGCTVRFAKVLEWKAAVAAIGQQVFEGGVYRHYKGGSYTTVCEATEEATGRSVVVYRNAEGRVWTRPTKDFFSVANQDGRLVARFAHCP